MRWLAQLGHHCVGVDRSADALSQASAFGDTVQADLEQNPWPQAKLPPGFDALVVTHYLWRPLIPSLRAVLVEGGVLLYETFTLAQAHIGRPSNPDFLLRPGELLALFGDWYVVAYEDGVVHDPVRCVQRIAAIKPTTGQTMPPAALSIESCSAWSMCQVA
ncbi:MAG: hypothetical protein OHK0048_12000 [Rhodoferax sp.]